MKENWCDVPEYDGLYRVSNLGRVKSLKFGKEKILRAGLTGKLGNKYLVVVLYKNKKPKTFRINVLVAMAFLGHIPCGHKVVVDHRDNEKLNNKLDNLQLITNRENLTKDKKNGTSKYTGVSWKKDRNKWQAQIVINRKVINLGHFTNELEAGQTYELALNNLSLFTGDTKKFREFLKSINFLL